MWHKHHLHLLKRMRKKGWSEKELSRAHSVLIGSHHKKTKPHKFLDYFIIWFSFVAIIVANLVAMFSLTPLLVFFPNSAMYFMLLVLGGTFGYLFTIVFDDVQHLLNGHQHYFMLILVPYFAIVGAILIMGVAADILPHLSETVRKPWLMGTLYVLAFMIPYILKTTLRKK